MQKQPVGRHIGKAAHKLRAERVPGISQRAKHPRPEVVNDDGRQGEEVDPQIGRRADADFLRRADQTQIARRKQPAEHCQKNAARKSQGRRVADCAAQLVRVALTPALGDHNAGADAHPAEKADQAGDQHGAGSDCRRGGAVDHIPDEDQVDGAVQLLHHAAKQQRQRKHKQFSVDRPCR